MRIAAMDLGSNSFHLLVVEARGRASFEPLLRDKEVLRLGDAVARHGRLSGPELDAAVAAVRRFRAEADALGAVETVAMATAAIREAENGTELVDRIEAEAGVSVSVISGAEEARLVFEAVRASVVLEPPPVLALDLGGGSLEVMVGDRAGLGFGTSLHLGVGRLTTTCVRDDPPSRRDVAALEARVQAGLDAGADEVARRRPRMLVGSSGTLCALVRAAEAQRSGSVPEAVNQLAVSRRDLLRLHERLLSLPARRRARLAGLDPRRADQAPAGSVLLLSVMERFGFEEVTACAWALREGMVLDAIARHLPGELEEDRPSIRRASVLDLCRRCGFDEAHARQVERLALALFDATSAALALDEADRELLGYGALLHDIGEHVAVDSHDRHTAYLVRHGRLRGFAPEEVDLLACLGRFHRRTEPKAGVPPFDALDEGARRRATRLVALLRVADALDRSHTGAVGDVAVELGPRRVLLRLRPRGDVDLELWGLRRKRGLLEQVLGLRVEAELDGASADRPAPPRPGEELPPEEGRRLSWAR